MVFTLYPVAAMVKIGSGIRTDNINVILSPLRRVLFLFEIA